MIRNLRFLFTVTAMVAALSFALTGCELEDETDGTDTTVAPDTAGTDTTPVVTYQEYTYVRIDDLSAEADTPDGGADIDAIVLSKGGTEFYADSVEAYEHGGGLGSELDPAEALNGPDAFEDWPDTDTCRVDGGFVSLGGLGGHLIVHMSAVIEAGDALTVLEVGGCDFDGGTAIIEPVDVYVSVAAEFDQAHWVSLGEGSGPEVFFTIPALTDVPLGE